MNFLKDKGKERIHEEDELWLREIGFLHAFTAVVTLLG